MEVSGFEGI